MDRRLKAIVVATLLLLAGCVSRAGGERPPEIYVMRHLAAETGADPGLTAEGARQAQLLIGWFASRKAPRAIFVSTYRRSRETAAPLAARLGVEPTVYDPSTSEALVASILRERGPVLVVGHSNTVPEIVERLGGARPAPIAHHEHGDIWRISGSPRTAQKLKLEP
jgi:phosphohistidine phosphatase SixA